VRARGVRAAGARAPGVRAAEVRARRARARLDRARVDPAEAMETPARRRAAAERVETADRRRAPGSGARGTPHRPILAGALAAGETVSTSSLVARRSGVPAHPRPRIDVRNQAARIWSYRHHAELEAADRFARLASRLSETGARAEIVEMARSAASDEARHATLCADLVRHFGGEPASRRQGDPHEVA